MNRKIALLGLLVISLFFETGCGKTKIPEKYSTLLSDKSGSVIRLAFYGTIEELDPIKAAESEQDKLFSNLIFASPLRKADNGNYEPYLFEKYEANLDGEQLVVKAKWKKGLKWHDGIEFNPNEFAFTIEQMKLSDKNSPYSEAAKEIVLLNTELDSIEIRFNSNSIKYLDMLCAGILPGHILAKENIASGTIEEAYNNFLNKPIGLGPYKITEKEDNYKYIVLEPNSNFYDGNTSNRPKIMIVGSFELQQTLSDFRENLYDWVIIPSMIAEQLQNLGIDDVVYKEYTNPAVLTWVFNTKNEKLKDVKVRKALNYIMSRDCAKQSFGIGSLELFDNLIPISNNKKSEDECLEEGIKLLEEAGIKDTNNDGIREYNSNPFKLNILVNNDNMSRKMIAERMINRLKIAGIDAEIESVSWNDFISGRLKTGKFETTLLSYHISNYCSMKSLFETKKENDNESLNFTGISDEELDRNLRILDSAVTLGNKTEASVKVNEKLSELCPCAFLIRPSNMVLVHGTPVRTELINNSLWNDVYNWKFIFDKSFVKENK